MANIETIKKLAQECPASINHYLDIKELMPENDAKELLIHGFVDCSSYSDECATYYKNIDWSDYVGAPVIAAVLIRGKITYVVLDPWDCQLDSFDNMANAIEVYEKTFNVKPLGV